MRFCSISAQNHINNPNALLLFVAALLLTVMPVSKVPVTLESPYTDFKNSTFSASISVYLKVSDLALLICVRVAAPSLNAVAFGRIAVYQSVFTDVSKSLKCCIQFCRCICG